MMWYQTRNKTTKGNGAYLLIDRGAEIGHLIEVVDGRTVLDVVVVEYVLVR